MLRRSFFLWPLALFLLSCTPQTLQPPLKASLLVYRFQPPAFLEFSEELKVVREILFAIPPSCGLFHVFSAPVGKHMAVELSCPNGQTVLFLETETGSTTQPITEFDSHFLAWDFDGSAAFLKIDSLGSPRIVRVSTEGPRDVLAITEFTYDLASSVNKGEFTFTFSRGLGQGSELWLAKQNGKASEQLYADPYNYISFARFSPDGRQIAFIKIPDTQTPFTVGGLWIMNSDGSNARKLAEADAGHGYAAAWSPEGARIAFVVRENPSDERADQSSAALISNIYVIDVKSTALTQVTEIQNGQAETPVWSPDGNTLAFNTVINDRMEVQIAELTTGEIRPLIEGLTCCPVWLQK